MIENNLNLSIMTNNNKTTLNYYFKTVYPIIINLNFSTKIILRYLSKKTANHMKAKNYQMVEIKSF